ncbi:hypothetical protein WMY93_004658 [Mugilogobius chulae]|uniref:Uncharacterized protein n=1 Tax=Mugilogobius chulae TaxID=88201 RepID=A0AAW0PQA5_9GOBI
MVKSQEISILSDDSQGKSKYAHERRKKAQTPALLCSALWCIATATSNERTNLEMT